MVVGAGVDILVHMLCKLVYAVDPDNALEVSDDVLDVFVLVGALVLHVAWHIECARKRRRHRINVDTVAEVLFPLVHSIGKALSEVEVDIRNDKSSCFLARAVNYDASEKLALVGVFGYFHHLVLFGIGLLAAAFRGRAALLL